MKICPLKFNNKTLSDYGEVDKSYSPCSCEGELCAWYIKETGECAISQIAREINIIERG